MNPISNAGLTGFGETATTKVDHTFTNPYKCLTWAAVIFSTAIQQRRRRASGRTGGGERRWPQGPGRRRLCRISTRWAPAPVRSDVIVGKLNAMTARPGTS